MGDPAKKRVSSHDMICCPVMFIFLKEEKHHIWLEEHHVWLEESSYADPLFCLFSVVIKLANDNIL